MMTEEATKGIGTKVRKQTRTVGIRDISPTSSGPIIWSTKRDKQDNVYVVAEIFLKEVTKEHLDMFIKDVLKMQEAPDSGGKRARTSHWYSWHLRALEIGEDAAQQEYLKQEIKCTLDEFTDQYLSENEELATSEEMVATLKETASKQYGEKIRLAKKRWRNGMRRWG